MKNFIFLWEEEIYEILKENKGISETGFSKKFTGKLKAIFNEKLYATILPTTDIDKIKTGVVSNFFVTAGIFLNICQL